MAKLYDQKCEDLARYFLDDAEPLLVEELAARIQECIDDWLSDMGL